MNPAERQCTNSELRARLDYDDAKLIAECDVHRYRASGPGGQHRNKVASAIRLHHRPSGLKAVAGRSVAIRRGADQPSGSICRAGLLLEFF